MFGKGISRAGDILDLATNIDLVKKSGAWYAYEGEKIGQGRENAKAYLESHPEVMETLDQKVRAHYALSGSEEAENELPDAEKKTGASSDLKLTPASKVADEAEKKKNDCYWDRRADKDKVQSVSGWNICICAL